MVLFKTKTTETTDIPRSILLAGMGILIFLIPIKFGMTFDSDISLFPQDIVQWIIYTWPNIIWQIGVLVFFAIWIVSGIVAGKIKIKYSLIDIFVIMFLISALWSSIKAPSIHKAHIACAQYIGYAMIYFFILNLIEDKKDAIYLLRILIISAVLISLYAIYQANLGLAETRDFASLYVSEKLPESFQERLYSNRAFASFIYPNTLAGYLLLAIPITAALTITKNRYISFAIVLCMLYALFLTFYTGSFVIFAGLTIIIASLYFIKNKRFNILIIVLTIFAIMCLFLVKYDSNLIDEIINTIIRRFRIWEAGIKMIAIHPFDGIGTYNFSVIYPKFKLDIAEEVQNAHNNFLQIFAEQGIFGFIFFCAIWFIVIKTGYLRLTNDKDNWITCGLFIGLTLFLMHNLVDYDWYVPGLTIIAWISIAILIYMREYYKVTIFEIKNWINRIMLIFFVSIIFVISVFYLGKIFISEYYFNEAKIAYKNENYILARVLANASVKLDKNNTDIYFLLGNICVHQNDYLHSSIFYKQAIQYNPFAATYYYNLALSYAHDMQVTGDVKFVEKIGECFQKAVSVYPTNPFYRLELARFYDGNNKHDLAIEEYKTCLSLNENMKKAYLKNTKLIKHLLLPPAIEEQIRSKVNPVSPVEH